MILDPPSSDERILTSILRQIESNFERKKGSHDGRKTDDVSNLRSLKTAELHSFQLTFVSSSSTVCFETVCQGSRLSASSDRFLVDFHDGNLTVFPPIYPFSVISSVTQSVLREMMIYYPIS